jgi:GT2 family glycosyltransferase
MTCDVVLVSYRSGPLVGRALRAVRTFAPVSEIIVVNNSPSDAGASAEATAAGAIVVENGGNRGFAAAVNQAIERSTSDYVMLVNPDVVAVRGSFSAIERLFARDPLAGGVGVRLENEDGTLQDSSRRTPSVFDFLGESIALSQLFPRWRRPRRFRMLDWQYDDERVVDAASGALLVLRRAALDAVGPFDERFFVYSEELDWFVRAKQAGWRTYFTPDVCAVHVGGGSSDAPSTRLSLLLQASWHTYSRKHLGRINAGLLQFALGAIELARIAAALFRPGRASRISDAVARLRVHCVGGFPARLIDREGHS